MEDAVSTRRITVEEKSVSSLSYEPEVVRERVIRELKASFIALHRTVPGVRSVECSVFYRPRWRVRYRNTRGVENYVYVDADEYGVRG